MRKCWFLTLFIFFGFEFSLLSQNPKIVCVGGTATEIVVALGFEEQIVGIDQTSTFPESIKKIPSVGYRNSIQTEGILSLEPSIIIYQKGYLKPEIESQLEAIKIVHLGIEEGYTTTQTKENIRLIASLLEVDSRGEELINTMKTDEDKLVKYLEKNQPNEAAKVLFIYSRGAGNVMVSGKGTFAESIIEMAGAKLAINNLSGFKPIDYESVLVANPTHLLYFDSGLASLGGKQAVQMHPILSKTTAVKHENGIISMDGLYVSGFGPRVYQAALELAKQLYPVKADNP